MFQKVDLRSMSMFDIFWAIESSTICVYPMREAELYLTLHIILRREGFESGCTDGECIDITIFYRPIDSSDSGDYMVVGVISRNIHCALVSRNTGADEGFSPLRAGASFGGRIY
jgi:hypothetical protein